MPTRRDFFRAAAVLPPSWVAFQNTVQGAKADEAYWRMVKRQFALDESILYLNAANFCPASNPVMDRYLGFLHDFQANPSFQNRLKYLGMQETLRTKVAGMLRVSPDEIAITRNASEGTNIIVKGAELKPGDEVLITDHNHPSNNDAWKVRARRDGFVVKSLPTPVPARSVDELISGFEKAITTRTRVVAFTHLTSTTGVLYPAREIAALARRRGIFVHLDGAQTFGALDVNLAEIDCDSYAASSHKWLMGPLETGVLYVRSERIPQIWPSIVTAGWSESLKGARKLEVFGQREDPRVVAVEAAIDFVALIGMQTVEARVRALTARLKSQLHEIPGVQLKTSMEPRLSGGVIKFRLAKMAPEAAYKALWERHRMAIAMTPAGDSEGLRFSPHIYNSPEEIDRAVAAVRELA